MLGPVSGQRRILLSLLAALGAAFLGAWLYFRPPGASVSAAVETAPVPSAGDAADDPAIWVDRADPAASLVLGTDKKGGLAVYDLAGVELQRFDNGTQNNVDLRADVPVGDGVAAIAVTSVPASRQVFVYRVDEGERRLAWLESSSFTTGIEPAGICLYLRSGRLFCFVTGVEPAARERGRVEQWELRFDATARSGADRFAAERVRRFDVGGKVEGCAADDEHGSFFVSEERVGVWSYGAEPEADESRVLLERVGLRGRLRGDAEGIALLALQGGDGALIVSSQGSDDFAVYDRRAPHAFRGRFRITAGAVDGVSHTDGIDVTAAALGPRFPQGLFVAQDDENDGENGVRNQNFKLVSWGEVERALAAED
jgi:3-phytase